MSVFDTAAKLPTMDKKGGKKAKREVIPVEGLKNYVMVDAVVKGYTALLNTFADVSKGDILNTFIGIGKQKKARPANFDGTDGDMAEASCQFRVRSTRSPLAVEEVAICDRHKIPVGDLEIKPEGYFVNPKYYDLLEQMKGLPDDFLLYQARESVKVVTEETVETVFQKGLFQLLDMVGVIAIRGKYNGTLKQALAEVSKYADAAEAAQKAEEEAEKAKAKAAREAKKAKG